MTNREWDVSEAWHAASVVALLWQRRDVHFLWNKHIFFFLRAQQTDFHFFKNFPRFKPQRLDSLFLFASQPFFFVVDCDLCRRWNKLGWNNVPVQEGKRQNSVFDGSWRCSAARSQCVSSVHRPRFCLSLNPTCHACQRLSTPVVTECVVCQLEPRGEMSNQIDRKWHVSAPVFNPLYKNPLSIVYFYVLVWTHLSSGIISKGKCSTLFNSYKHPASNSQALPILKHSCDHVFVLILVFET